MRELEVAARMLSPETIPVTVSVLPAAWLRHGEELKRVTRAYPQFFQHDPDLDRVRDSLPQHYRAGQHVDEWGCVWSNIAEGNDAIVTGHPVKCEEDIFNLKIPENRDGNLPHGFFYLRLLDLCGFELGMTLFAEEDEALRVLIDKVLTYDCYQMEVLLERYRENWFVFGDDLGMQAGLAIGAERWRKYVKPAYAKLYGMIRKKNPDAAIYMHTDGCIWEIMPDLVEAGVTMINPQFRANGIDHLVEVCRRKQVIPIHLDLDRQMFPFAKPAQLEEHVRECVQELYLPQGGLGLSLELNYEIPLDNIVALLDSLEKWRHYRG